MKVQNLTNVRYVITPVFTRKMWSGIQPSTTKASKNWKCVLFYQSLVMNFISSNSWGHLYASLNFIRWQNSVIADFHIYSQEFGIQEFNWPIKNVILKNSIRLHCVCPFEIVQIMKIKHFINLKLKPDITWFDY